MKYTYVLAAYWCVHVACFMLRFVGLLTRSVRSEKNALYGDWVLPPVCHSVSEAASAFRPFVRF